MTNEVKNVPELRFPEFSSDWEEKKLKDISNKGMYGIGASATEFDGKNVYVRITDINESSRKIDNDKLTSPDRLDKKYLLNENDVLFARTGASTGKTYIHKHYDRDKNYYFAGFLIKFAFNNNYLASFIFQNTLTKRFENWVSVMSVRSGQPGINSEEYGKLKMRFPNKVEQNKIGNFFTKLDRQIELEEQKLAKLEEQKKGYMQKIFSQELRFKDENGNAYPEWKERKFSELLSYSSNGVDKKINKNHDIAYMVNYMDVFKKTKLNTKNRDLLMEITATKIQKEKNNLKKGDILFTPSSETREDIAKSTVVFEDLDNTVYSYHLIRLRPLDSNIFSLKYSNYLSEQNFISKQFRRLAQGAQRYTLTKEHFENIKLNLPHIKEQEKIGAFFSKLDEVINKQSQKIDELKLRKQGFLQKMFV